eukprot:1946223-Alexandrium_andersonii.AAC.1
MNASFVSLSAGSENITTLLKDPTLERLQQCMLQLFNLGGPEGPASPDLGLHSHARAPQHGTDSSCLGCGAASLR